MDFEKMVCAKSLCLFFAYGLDLKCPFFLILPSARKFDTVRDLSDNAQPRRTHASAPCNLNLHVNEYLQSLLRTWKEPGAEALLYSAACRYVQFCSSGRSPALFSMII
ncbi:hypothetical protein EVAR_100316_1 [Eumeta japonica]|uniref:Uncharacterized protein n=1 Tax=Eumeta variegata TaxID=151549 RepID=A0A4C2ABZ8_EUMVA|nr:hypothetical protein EVAR_100316_1 [Eumeta japonica]